MSSFLRLWCLFVCALVVIKSYVHAKPLPLSLWQHFQQESGFMALRQKISNINGFLVVLLKKIDTSVNTSVERKLKSKSRIPNWTSLKGGKLIATWTDITICFYFLTGYEMTLQSQSNISIINWNTPHEQKKQQHKEMITNKYNINMWRLKGVCSRSVLTEFMSWPLNTTDASEPLPLLSVKICRVVCWETVCWSLFIRQFTYF